MTAVQPPKSPSPLPAAMRSTPRLRSVAVMGYRFHPAQPRREMMLLIAGVLLGLGLRLGAWHSGRSLWIDEAMLALNIIDRSAAELLQPLDYNQGAPIGFLFAVKAAVVVFGASEESLRLVPLVASLAGLVGFAVLAWRLLPPAAAGLAVALCAVSPHLISYAAECKQYASDAAVTIGLGVVAQGVLQGRGGWRWGLLAAAGVVAVWCSHPAVFILGGIGTTLIFSAAMARDRPRLLAALGAIAAWLASFTFCYFLSLKDLSQNRYLTQYWSDHFWPVPPRSLRDVTWLVEHALQFFTQPGGFGHTFVPLGGFAAVLALLGWRDWLRENRVVACALVLPVVWVVVASGLQKYPVGGRLMLFWVPVALLLVARGAGSVMSRLHTTHPLAAWLLGTALLAAPGGDTVGELRRPSRLEELAPVLREVRNHWQPGDRAYVYYGAIPAFRYYTRHEPWPAAAVVYGHEHRGNPTGYRDELACLRGRVWLIVSHRHGDEETLLRTWLSSRGPCEQVVQYPGAAAYYYRLPE